MGNWGIQNTAPKSEKIKAEFGDLLHGLNATGEIDYNTYSQLFDLSMALLDDMYTLGQTENAKEKG